MLGGLLQRWHMCVFQAGRVLGMDCGTLSRIDKPRVWIENSVNGLVKNKGSISFSRAETSSSTGSSTFKVAGLEASCPIHEALLDELLFTSFPSVGAFLEGSLAGRFLVAEQGFDKVGVGFCGSARGNVVLSRSWRARSLRRALRTSTPSITLHLS